MKASLAKRNEKCSITLEENCTPHPIIVMMDDEMAIDYPAGEQPLHINPSQAPVKKPTEAELQAELEAPTLAAESKAQQILDNTPLDVCVFHKDWRVRKLAYEKLVKVFDEAGDEEPFREFAQKIPDMINDKNSAAQSASIDVVKIFAEKAPLPVVSGIAEDVGKFMADKCLKGGPKHANTKRASAAILAMVGADCGEAIIKSFANSGFANKNVKVKLGTVSIISAALATYGKKEVPIDNICAKLPMLIQDPNTEIRTAGKKLAILLHDWTKRPASDLVAGAKEMIVKELEAQFEKNDKKPKPKATKRTRSKEGTPEDAESDDDKQQKPSQLTNAAMDLASELKKKKVTIEDGGNKTESPWEEAYESSDWKQNKAAIDVVLETVGAKAIDPFHNQVSPRRAKKKRLHLKSIAAGSESILFPKLYEWLNNSKMPTVVKASLELIMALMKNPDGSNRVEFCSEHGMKFASSLVKRLGIQHKVYDEKVIETFELIMKERIVKISSLTGEIAEALKVKKPAAKANMMQWVANCLGNYATSSEFKGQASKFFVSIFGQEKDAAAGDIRNAALHGLAAVRVVAGEKSSADLYERLDDKRKAKIDDDMAIIQKSREKYLGNSSKGKKARTPRNGAMTPKRNGPMDMTEILRLKVESGDKKVMWVEAYESVDWQVHKAAIDEVIKAISKKKALVAGSEMFLFPRLSKLIGESKMPTVVKAGTDLVLQIVNKMTSFRTKNARSLVVAYLKRVTMPSVVYDKLVVSALELIVSKKYLRMMDVRSEIEQAMKNRSPRAKCALMRAVASCLSWGVVGPELKHFGDWFSGFVNDRQIDLRNAGIDGLSALWAAAGEKNVIVWVAKLDDARKRRVAEGVTRYKKQKNSHKSNVDESKRAESRSKPSSPSYSRGI